ncbi:MAG: rubrerythrin family protein [Promethearchaeota archaeon]
MVKDMTEANLRNAYAGESQAHMRYIIYKEMAEKEGFPNVSRLFHAAAYAEKVHASTHFKHIKTKGEFQTVGGAIFGTENTSEALQAGIDGESFEIAEMYPAYRSVAQTQGEKGADTSFRWAMEAEKNHLGLYQRAKHAVDQGKDADFGEFQVCPVCGHTVEGNAPDKCPVCNTPGKHFKTF